jgi:serine/threonine protein kinase
MQVRDINRGSFGFVQLAKRRDTGKQVAIKFIARGDKVSVACLLSFRTAATPAPTTSPAPIGSEQREDGPVCAHAGGFGGRMELLREHWRVELGLQ